MLVYIERYDPDTNEIWQQNYQVFPPRESFTVMDLLATITLRLDPSLAFFQHSSCNHGICGRCALLINGKVRLACTEVVDPSKPLFLAPVPGFEVIRDLVTVSPTTSFSQDRRAPCGL